VAETLQLVTSSRGAAGGNPAPDMTNHLYPSPAQTTRVGKSSAAVPKYASLSSLRIVVTSAARAAHVLAASVGDGGG
jgi:hypothetical protein